MIAGFLEKRWRALFEFDEGFYDYEVTFDQNNEAKTATNFKVRAEATKPSLDLVNRLRDAE